MYAEMTPMADNHQRILLAVNSLLPSTKLEAYQCQLKILWVVSNVFAEKDYKNLTQSSSIIIFDMHILR